MDFWPFQNLQSLWHIKKVLDQQIRHFTLLVNTILRLKNLVGWWEHSMTMDRFMKGRWQRKGIEMDGESGILKNGLRWDGFKGIINMVIVI